MGKYEIGTTHETKNHGAVEVVGYVDRKHRRIRFINTGFETVASTQCIHRGLIKDCNSPSVMGVGFLGDCSDYESHPLRKTLYRRWSKMIERCHLLGSRKTIDSSWYCFATFMRDALELKGVELLYQHSKDNIIDLDSDIIAVERGVESTYSKDTCQWVTRAENLRVRNRPKTYKKHKTGDVYQSKAGPVVLVAKDYSRWLIEFEDGTRRWVHSNSVWQGVINNADDPDFCSKR